MMDSPWWVYIGYVLVNFAVSLAAILYVRHWGSYVTREVTAARVEIRCLRGMAIRCTECPHLPQNQILDDAERRTA